MGPEISRPVYGLRVVAGDRIHSWCADTGSDASRLWSRWDGVPSTVCMVLFLGVSGCVILSLNAVTVDPIARGSNEGLVPS